MKNILLGAVAEKASLPAKRTIDRAVTAVRTSKTLIWTARSKRWKSGTAVGTKRTTRIAVRLAMMSSTGTSTPIRPVSGTKMARTVRAVIVPSTVGIA
jgi:hypothetical protein